MIGDWQVEVPNNYYVLQYLDPIRGPDQFADFQYHHDWDDMPNDFIIDTHLDDELEDIWPAIALLCDA